QGRRAGRGRGREGRGAASLALGLAAGARRAFRRGSRAGREGLMAISGPHGSHHHDDDSGDAPPAVFSDINITPLTDIFLVLLIIFMVTSTALVEAGQGGAGAGVRVDLPKGAAKELHIAAQDFPVAILADGRTVIEGKVVDAQQLRERLTKLHNDAPDAQLIIQADTGTHHGKVVEVMEIAKSVGLDKLAIATESEGSK